MCRQLSVEVDIVFRQADPESRDVEGYVQDAEKDQGQLSRHGSPECAPVRLAKVLPHQLLPSLTSHVVKPGSTHKQGVKLPPFLLLRPDVKHPSPFPQFLKAPTANPDDDVEHDRDDEEVCGENELVVEEMRDDAQEDSEE